LFVDVAFELWIGGKGEYAVQSLGLHLDGSGNLQQFLGLQRGLRLARHIQQDEPAA
jgi:hypothetical protein